MSMQVAMEAQIGKRLRIMVKDFELRSKIRSNTDGKRRLSMTQRKRRKSWMLIGICFLQTGHTNKQQRFSWKIKSYVRRDWPLKFLKLELSVNFFTSGGSGAIFSLS